MIPVLESLSLWDHSVGIQMGFETLQQAVNDVCGLPGSFDQRSSVSRWAFSHVKIVFWNKTIAGLGLSHIRLTRLMGSLGSKKCRTMRVNAIVYLSMDERCEAE